MPISWLGKVLRGGAARRPIKARNNRRACFELVRLEERSLLSYGLSVLANFNATDGAYPTGSLIEDSSGNLFGTTADGGLTDTNGSNYGGDGTVFEWVKSTGKISVLANFNATDGAYPTGSLVEDSSGDLFGTTDAGGTYGYGTVFEWVKSTDTISVLASFNFTDGAAPNGSLIEDSSGDLFGTTNEGGTGSNYGGDGTVFEWVKSTGKISVLANFTGINGANPEAGMIADGSGNLFGTTAFGGPTDTLGLPDTGDGTVFEWVKSTGTISVLANFSAFNVGPGSLIEDSSGNLFGTTAGGGDAEYDGTVFEWVKSTGTISVLADFGGINGAAPHGSLIEDSSGDLFGTTALGGPQYDLNSGGYDAGNGTVFEWTKSSGTISDLFDFSDSNYTDVENGDEPEGGLIEDSSGDFFGTCSINGTTNNADGTVFELTPNNPQIVLNTVTDQGLSDVALNYTIAQESVTQALRLDVYQSATPTISSSPAIAPVSLGSEIINPSTDPSDLSIGSHTVTIPLNLASIPVDPTRPYLLVVADADTSVTEGAGSVNVVSTPFPYTPAEIRAAYGLPPLSNLPASWSGANETIAIVVDNDDPTLFTDVNTFDSTFGITHFGNPGGPNLAIYTVLNEVGVEAVLNDVPLDQHGIPVSQSGNPPVTLPPPDSTGVWAEEEALDVEWAHAIAPDANIDVVEVYPSATVAPSGANVSIGLLTAAKVAGGLPGVSVVSMSWGAIGSSGNYEDPSETNYDRYFTAPGVTYIAASGDYGSQLFGYPSASPYVLNVGGTSLHNLDSQGDYPGTGADGEIGWGNGSNSSTLGGSGGGVSQFEKEPQYQNGFQFTNQRTVPDVAFDADPYTGVYSYDSFNPTNSSQFQSWAVGNGTSLGAPCWAGLIAIVNEGRVGAGRNTLYGATQTLPALYALPSSDFHDDLGGDNGTNNGPGSGIINSAVYDEVTGLGSPIAQLLVPALIHYQFNVTSQVDVSKSGLVYNRATQLFGGTITLTNAGTTTLFGTLEFEVTGLPAGVTLANASGTAADGNPFIAVNLANGLLAPGQSFVFAVQFKNPKLLSFVYGFLVFD